MGSIALSTPPPFVATKYRVSTITVTGAINSEINLERMFESICDRMLDSILYVEYGDKRHMHVNYVDTSKKPSRRRKNGSEKKPVTVKKRFDNQLTLVFTENENKYNAKLFKNGNVQITGVKDAEKGREAVDFIIKATREAHVLSGDVLTHVDQLENINYRTRLINSDFKVNFEIRLDHLFTLMTSKYDIICSYEPCIYPGAKIEYYYPTGGRCLCEGFCNGKSEQCKKITIAVFQSGCIIITGANCMDHVKVAYKFICDVLSDNVDAVYRRRLMCV